MTKQPLTLNINGESRELFTSPARLLLDLLREDLGLTGSKRGCDDSSCGACAVLLDGTPVLACATLAGSCEGSRITTVEALAPPGELDPVQEGYAEAGGSQCGFCTAGFMITTRALLDRNPNPTLEEIRQALSANLCRCTGYMQIYESVKFAMDRAASLKAAASSPSAGRS